MGGLTPIRMTRGEALPQPADAGSDTPGVPGGSYRDRLGAVRGTRGTVLRLVARFPNVEILHPRLLFRARDLGRGLGGRTRSCRRVRTRLRIAYTQRDRLLLDLDSSLRSPKGCRLVASEWVPQAGERPSSSNCGVASVRSTLEGRPSPSRMSMRRRRSSWRRPM